MKIDARDVRRLARAMGVRVTRNAWYTWQICGVNGWYEVDGHEVAMDAIRNEAMR